MNDVPLFYPDKVSAEAGESVVLYASAPRSPCSLTITRVGGTQREVAKFEGIVVREHDIPRDADQCGCGWPAAFEFEVEASWPSGYYDLSLEDDAGQFSRHFVCVRAPSAARRSAAIVLSTNTYTAYNYWGGANAYGDVEGLKKGRIEPHELRAGAIGRLSRMRPFAQGLLAPSSDIPRLINQRLRGIDEVVFPMDRDWVEANSPSPFDGSAGFLHKWEHVFAIWAEFHGYQFDYLTDFDFEESDSTLLEGYSTILLVGHSEYWSRNQRAALDDFVDAGGNLAIFSGNTCFWKVRWEEDGETMVSHKWLGEQNDPLWDSPDTRKDATHLWSHPEFENPEAKLTGLSFLYGGYHRLAMCASRGAAGFVIYNDKHWALEGTDLYYGDVLGGQVPLVGYENDGCPIRFGDDGLPKPDGGKGVPSNLEIIGFVPATIAEREDIPYPKIIPQEDADNKILAGVAYAADDEKAVERLLRGHAVLASFKRGRGEVFNSGTTEWVHGLAADDEFIERITHNVLSRFRVFPGSVAD